MPTATSLRKNLEIQNKRLSRPMREAVSQGLSHSLGTAQQYYQAPTISDTYSAYSVMQDIIGGARAKSPDTPTQKEESEEGEKGKKAKLKWEEGDSTESRETADHGRKGKKGKERATHRNGQEEDEEKEGVRPLRPSPRKRRKVYSEEQMELITKYFGQHITQKSFPTTIECRDFVALDKTHFQDRTPKGIYDKYRNIAGR